MSSCSDWPRHLNYQWHETEELHITICYLSFGAQHTQPRKYMISNREEEIGVPLEGTRTMAIKLPKSNGSAETRRRFHRTMKILRLEPYLHPSQRSSIITPAFGVEEDAEESDVEGAGWPKMVLFADCTSVMPGSFG